MSDSYDKIKFIETPFTYEQRKSLFIILIKLKIIYEVIGDDPSPIDSSELELLKEGIMDVLEQLKEIFFKLESEEYRILRKMEADDKEKRDRMDSN